MALTGTEKKPAPTKKKTYRPPQVRSQSVLLPNLFACSPPLIECPDLTCRETCD